MKDFKELNFGPFDFDWYQSEIDEATKMAENATSKEELLEAISFCQQNRQVQEVRR